MRHTLMQAFETETEAETAGSENTFEVDDLEIDLQSIEKTNEQINETFDTIDSLDDIKDIVDSQKEVLTIPALETIFKSINRLRNKLGIDNSIAVETHCVKTNYMLANEGVIDAIGSAIAAVWQAIINTLKKIGDFFTGLFNTSKQGSATAQKNKERAGQISSKGLTASSGELAISKSSEKVDKNSVVRKSLILMYNQFGRKDYPSLINSLKVLKKGIENTSKLSGYLYEVSGKLSSILLSDPKDWKMLVDKLQVDFSSVTSGLGKMVKDNDSINKNDTVINFGDDWPGLKNYKLFIFKKLSGEQALICLSTIALETNSSKKIKEFTELQTEKIKTLTADQIEEMSVLVKECFDDIQAIAEKETPSSVESGDTCINIKQRINEIDPDVKKGYLYKLLVSSYRAVSSIEYGGGIRIYKNSEMALKCFNSYCGANLKLYK